MRCVAVKPAQIPLRLTPAAVDAADAADVVTNFQNTLAFARVFSVAKHFEKWYNRNILTDGV